MKRLSGQMSTGFSLPGQVQRVVRESVSRIIGDEGCTGRGCLGEDEARPPAALWKPGPVCCWSEQQVPRTSVETPLPTRGSD
jgi:hypothetical protein